MRGPDRALQNDGDGVWGELFSVWRYHAFITNSDPPAVVADRVHRRHALIEQVIAELKGGPPAHLPSGVFNANEAWLQRAVIALNLSRVATVAAFMPLARMRTLDRPGQDRPDRGPDAGVGVTGSPGPRPRGRGVRGP